MKRKLFLLILLITLYACEDRQPTNPLIQGYDVPIPELQSITAINDQTAELKWSYTDERATAFQIYRGLTDKDLTAHALTDSFTTTWQDSGLVIDTTYYYQISARFDENESELCNLAEFIMSIPPPINLTAQAIDDQSLKLTWMDNCSFETGYRIEVKTDNGAFETLASLAENSTEFIHTGVQMDTKYEYRVFAFTQSNVSKHSNTAVAIIYTIEGMINGIWKVTSTTNSYSDYNLKKDETLTFSNAAFDGTVVTGNVEMFTVYYGNIAGTFNYNPSVGSLFLEFSQSPSSRTFKNVTFSTTTLAMADNSYTYSCGRVNHITQYDASILNNIWKVTSTTNSYSDHYLKKDETLTFSNAAFDGTVVTGNVEMFTVYYGNVAGTFNYNPSIGSLFLEFSQSPTKRTYKNANFSTTTLSMADNDYTYTLTKQ